MGEFTCAMCRRRCNACLPIEPVDAVVNERTLVGSECTRLLMLLTRLVIIVTGDDAGLLSIDQAVVAVERALSHMILTHRDDDMEAPVGFGHINVYTCVLRLTRVCMGLHVTNTLRACARHVRLTHRGMCK
jgi:hypothetical protein